MVLMVTPSGIEVVSRELIPRRSTISKREGIGKNRSCQVFQMPSKYLLVPTVLQ